MFVSASVYHLLDVEFIEMFILIL